MTVPPEREIGREVVGAMHRSTGSYELVVAAIAAAALGFWIDSVLGVRPWFTLVFAIVGFIGASYSIWLDYRTSMLAVSASRAERVAGSIRATDELAKPRDEGAA